MGKLKKGQGIILETNVKILIVFIVIAAVLSGIFFFGDRFSAFYNNFVPQNNGPEPFDERIYPDYESYRIVIPEKIESKIEKQKLSLENVRNILSLHTILEVRRGGKTIVRSNFDSGEDPDPSTRKIELLFDRFFERNDVRVESVYDAQQNRVVSRYFLGGSSDFSYIYCDSRTTPSSVGERIPKLNKGGRSALSNIICARDRDSFAYQVVDAVNKEHCKIKIGNKFIKKIFGDSAEAQKKEVLKMLLGGRSNYRSSWDSGGLLSDGRMNERYSCDFGSGDFVLCVPNSPKGFLKKYPSGEEVSEIKYKAGDEIFYFKDEGIWRMKYPDVTKLSGSSREEVENNCVYSAISGGECK